MAQPSRVKITKESICQMQKQVIEKENNRCNVLNYISSILFNPDGQTLVSVRIRKWGPIVLSDLETGKSPKNDRRTCEETFIVCPLARMEKRSQVAVEIIPPACGTQRQEN